VHPAATQNFPVLPDFSFDITLFGVLTANYCKLCVHVQRKQSEIVWREYTHDVTSLLPDISGNRSGVQKDISLNISVTVEVKKIWKPPFVLIVNIIRKIVVFCFAQKICFGQHESYFYFFLSRKARNFFPEFHIRLYDKNSESEYFFQQHWELEYFFRKITYPLPLQVKWSFPYN
jgi:hypothetical protein